MKLVISILFSFFVFSGFSQSKKQMQAFRIAEPIKIDGVLDEDAWEKANAAMGFVQNSTKPGEPSTQKSEVRFLYDDNAIYIGAILHDVSSDSILRELGKRDTESNTDLFGVILDTYRDGINAFAFLITPAGVQLDARYSSNGSDFEWNAVWESRVQINEKSWVVEFRIPYSAIRFSKAEIQTWGINFVRKIRRHREVSYWNTVNPAVMGMVNQAGEVYGIEKIKSPVRLSVTPYVSSYADRMAKTIGSSTTTTFNAGADIKYGINESFTMDMTLVPDFGQVQSDNLVLNLSPFEIQFNDFRPFFSEGTELFNRGGLFYSRRVGGAPRGFHNVQSELAEDEKILNNPSTSQLINASKISGRTQNGLGIGVFNATTASTFATIENSKGEKREILTDPLTNYSVIVFDQSLKNNSFVSLVNTNVMRDGNYYDANVGGVQFRLLDKKVTYAIGGDATLTQKFLTDRVQNGHAYNIYFSKESGNLNYYVGNAVKSDTYDPRDLGFLMTNNEINYSSGVGYHIFKPFWKVNNFHSFIDMSYSNRYDSNAFQDFNISGRVNTTITKYFFSTGMNIRLEPLLTYDYFEPRSPGRFYTFPTSNSINYWFSSDYRKKFALDGTLFFHDINENNRNVFNFSLSPRFRASNKLFFVFNNRNDFKKDDVGFVNNIENQIFFGIRDVITRTNTLTTTYTFTNRMAVSLRMRHYWSEAVYSKYQLLEEDGLLSNSNYSGQHNVNFNAFNIDLVYTWNFAPGSEMTLVWKNSILKNDADVYLNYFGNFRNTLDSPQLNSISLKLLYYLDYLTVKSALKK